MAKTKFTRGGKEIRRSGRNYVPKENPPSMSSPASRRVGKSRGSGGAKRSEPNGSPPLRISPRTKRSDPNASPPLRSSPCTNKKVRWELPESKKGGKGGATGSVPKSSQKRGKGGGGGCTGYITKQSKKRKRSELDSPIEIEELDSPIERDDAYSPMQRYAVETSSSDNDCGDVVGYEESKEDDVDDGFSGIAEEICTDLAIYGEEARNDRCEVDEDDGDDYAWDAERIPEPLSSDDENEKENRAGEPYREDIDPEELMKLGKCFSDADDFKHACLRYTIKTRRNIKYVRSTTLMIGAVCAATMREDQAPCPWKIYCAYEKKKEKLMIKTYVNTHTCELTGESKLLKRSAIANLFSERLRLNPKMTAKEIKEEIRREYMMIALLNSCIKAKTMVMKQRRKTHEEHFDRIWDYQAEVLRSNPGSTFEIETIPGPRVGSKQRFYRLYMCYQAQKESWKKTCRPVIGLDGAFLKWDIKGQLLAAVGRDADNRIVPIAWAVVEIENDTNWDWFVKLLVKDLDLGLGKDYVLMSDKQKGLVKAIHNVLPEVEHRQCCRHIYENWRKSGKDLRLQRLFWYIAKSYTPGLYQHNISQLEAHDAGAHRSLLLTKPESWSRAFFKIGSFCNDNLNNLSESFNKTIREARKKPLLDLLEGIRVQCMTRNYNRSILANNLKTTFTKKTQRELDRVEKKSVDCQLHWAIGPETEVDYKGHSYVVSIEEQTCACRSWQLNGIPCIHAAKVILASGKKLSDFVSDCYTTIRWRETYSYGIRPLNGQMEWPRTNRLGVIPPPNKAGNPGRPRNHDRKKGQNETETKISRAYRVITCSNCQKQGHNKSTCGNDFQEPPAKKPRGRPKKNQGLQFDESEASQQQFSFNQSSAWELPQSSQGQNSQAQSSNAQTSGWEHGYQYQASQTQGWIPTRGWGQYFGL